MISIAQINVLSSRARNRRQHQEIVDNIEAVGLKRPITVRRREEASEFQYDLVCGEGRLEAFRMLGETEIAAVVIDASEPECLLRGLVENIARRKPRPIDAMEEIGSLHKRGYSETLYLCDAQILKCFDTQLSVKKEITSGRVWVGSDHRQLDQSNRTDRPDDLQIFFGVLCSRT